MLSLINDEFRVPLIATSKPSSNTISLLRTVRHLPKEYNCVQLLHKDANGIIRYMIPILQSEFLQFILSCNVILIRNWTSMDIYAKVMSNIFMQRKGLNGFNLKYSEKVTGF